MLEYSLPHATADAEKADKEYVLAPFRSKAMLLCGESMREEERERETLLGRCERRIFFLSPAAMWKRTLPKVEIASGAFSHFLFWIPS